MNYDRASQTYSSNTLLYFEFVKTASDVLTMQETRTYATLLNTFRFGFSRAWIDADSAPTISEPPGLHMVPGASVTGAILFSLGGGVGAVSDEGTSNPTRFFTNNQFDFADQVLKQKGAHELQFGMKSRDSKATEISGTPRPASSNSSVLISSWRERPTHLSGLLP